MCVCVCVLVGCFECPIALRHELSSISNPDSAQENIFLPDINNERDSKNATYKANLKSCVAQGGVRTDGCSV
jgi:hypothetical protein